MAGVPWLKIVQLAPSIIDMSRELLKLSKKTPEQAPTVLNTLESESELARRIVALETNERRQAELVNEMAQQVEVLSHAVTVLHRRMLWLGGTVLTLVLALIIVVGTR